MRIAYRLLSPLLHMRAWSFARKIELSGLQGKTLELGCGTGHLAHLLKRRGAMQVTATDARNLGFLPPDALCDAAHLPFPDASFDCVLICGVLQYVEDVSAVMAEVGRVLAAGGRLTIVQAVAETRTGRLVRKATEYLQGPLPDRLLKITGGKEKLDSTLKPRRIFSSGDLLQAVRALPLCAVSHRTVRFPPLWEREILIEAAVVDSHASISIIIPARNEELLLASTLDAACTASIEAGARAATEIIVVDNASTDGTADVTKRYGSAGVRLVECAEKGCAQARNTGARHASGGILVFVDADTLLPRDALLRILDHLRLNKDVGLGGLASRERGLRAWCWWSFWGMARRLPLARAKAMPACLFCTRKFFEEHGPFDETVSIAEEWKVLTAFIRRQPERFILDRGLVARSSSRRMELRRFGYLRTYMKWCGVVLFPALRRHYDDAQRAPRAERQSRCVGRAGSVLRWLINKVEINDVRVLPEAVIKQRQAGACFLIPPANLLFRLFGDDTRVLPAGRWLEHEKRVYEVLYGGSVPQLERSLILPRLPGISLEKMLSLKELPANEKLAAVALAIQGLFQLHAATLDGSGGLTHGDAHAGNVLISLDKGKAYWFDFETCHAKRLSLLEKRTHDLCVLMLSAAGLLCGHFEELARLVAAHYPCRHVLPLLRRRAEIILLRPCLFMRARTRLGAAETIAFGRVLIDVLSRPMIVA